MPMTSRPQMSGGNSMNRRRSFREITDDRRPRGNGNGNGNGHGAPAGSSRNLKTAPPEATSAENFYYLKQMSAKTPMVIVLTDGEQLHGWIEWYDRNCLKLNREGAPNLLIQKHCIKYLHKRDE
jgi:sRNA-binding regulator protein Hfq